MTWLVWAGLRQKNGMSALGALSVRAIPKAFGLEVATLRRASKAHLFEVVLLKGALGALVRRLPRRFARRNDWADVILGLIWVA